MLGALLAWEGGNGRGHIVTLKAVAEAVSDRFTFDAALCRLDFADELSQFCQPVQGPLLPRLNQHRIAQGNPPMSTWGEFMGDIGFRDTLILQERFTWWQSVMRDCDISLLIAANAPCALMAARGLGIPSVAVGTGYFLPPANMATFPILLPQNSVRIHDEAEIVGTVNSVARDFNIPELASLPEVYAATDQLAFTLEMLDPYTEWRNQPLLAPIIGGEVERASGGDEIFVYFSTREASDDGLAAALENLGVPVRAFCPGLEEEELTALARKGVMVERAPVPIDLIAKRSRLLVHAGQHGILCAGLAAGLPQVTVPDQAERLYNSEAAAARGVSAILRKPERSAEVLRKTILDAYENVSMARNAKDVAADLAPVFQESRRKLIRRRLAAAMD